MNNGEVVKLVDVHKTYHTGDVDVHAADRVNIDITGVIRLVNVNQLDDFAIVHGNLRPPPPNGFVDGEFDDAAAESSAVITLSPSFNPSVTSVTMPSLIPVLICTGFGRLNDKV